MQPETPATVPQRPLAVAIFLGPWGLRPGWRVVLFFLLTGVILAALQFISHPSPVRIWGIDLPVLFLSALGATWLMLRLGKQPFSSAGLGAVHWGRNLASGIGAGFVALSVLLALLAASGAFHAEAPDLHGSEIARWGLYWALAFIFTALGEELLMRGYALFALSQGVGFWPAAAILSLLFGAGHMGNFGEESLGIANAMLAGLVFAFSVKWTGTLWWAIGCHMSWDWGETFFYGVANSGGPSHHHFLSGSPAGPVWLSGGTVGPEGSALATVVLLLLAVAMRYTSPRYQEPALERRSIPQRSAAECGIIGGTGA